MYWYSSLDSIYSNAQSHFPRRKISRKRVSKIVLSCIASQINPPDEIVSELGIECHIDTLHEIYVKYREKISESKFPKYLPFYRFIQNNIQAFDYEWEFKRSRFISHLKLPYVNYGKPSLLCLLLSILNQVDVSVPRLKMEHYCPIQLKNNFLYALGKHIEENDFIWPDESDWDCLARLFKRGFLGEKITLVSVICPDYSYEKVNDSFQYTFKYLGSDIGLVARRAATILRGMQLLLNSYDIQTDAVILGGDFEALDYETLENLGETETTFFAKVKETADKTANQVGEECISELFIDDQNKRNQWMNLNDQALSMMENGDFGVINNGYLDLDEVLKKRMPLYKSWIGEKSIEEYFRKLLIQGAEYAAMGSFINKKWRNSLILGADHFAMRPFYDFFQKSSVMYIKSFY